MSQRSAPAVIGPDLRSALVAMVRKRVPESEVEDIVQATLAEALESPNAPKESDALRRWLFGVAKHKIVDHHRRAGRVSFDLPEVSEGPAPHAEADLLRWAERHLPPGDDAKKTLGWMLREGDGEKLEAIAESEKVPAPRVRQRVSRLRRHLKQHWAREVAVLAALGVVVTALFLLLREPEPEPIAHDPRAVPAPVDPRAEPLRKAALEHCAASEWEPCLEGLDEAKRLDPAGDARPEVQRARAAAKRALTPPPAPSPSPAPTPTLAPAPKPTLAPTLAPAPAPTPTLAPKSKPTKAIPIPTSAPSASAPLTREELLRRKELLGRKNAPVPKKVVPRKAPATK